MSKANLSLPPDFNTKTNLLMQMTENGVFHESRKGAAFAHRLVANGTPQDLELSEKVLDAVLMCQELHLDDPHYGNFYWMKEDTVVFDLNAVEFNLEHLIPMMIQYGDRLPDKLHQRVLHAIRLGLAEIEKLDVLVVYSNITLLDILNTCLGGELLGDARIIQRGYQKLVKWSQLTNANGTPYEFNSPTYTSVDIRALKVLVNLAQDSNIRILAQAALVRLGLSVALHIHLSTQRWAGPHGRAYQPSIACETVPELLLLKDWIEDGTLPTWLLAAVEDRPDSLQVDETSFQPRKMTLTTFHSESFALGTSSCELSGQSNVIMGHYQRPGNEKPGVIYSRYLTNEKWLGDFYHATDRTKSRNLIDEGRFWGVQQGSRMIGLYCPPQNLGVIHSAKAVLIWTGVEAIDEIWVGEKRIDGFEASVLPGEVVVIGSGNAFTAVHVLSRTDMGRNAPVRLREIQGCLVLEIYNYLGPEKSFWEMNWPGAFYQGKPLCGFYLEMAERKLYKDGRAFGRLVAEGKINERIDEPFVYAGDQSRSWQISYQRDGLEVGIEVDLMEWNLIRRWNQNGELGFPMLNSPLAWQDDSGEIRLGDAILRWGEPGKPLSPAWLFAVPQRKLWVAGLTGIEPDSVYLETPEGHVRIPKMSCGYLVWRNGTVTLNGDTGEATVLIQKYDNS